MLPLSARIPLNRGKRGFCLVSAEDFERLSKYNWTRDSNGYVCRSASYRDENGKYRRRKVLLHREILQAPPGAKVDHREHRKLDNRRGNIRIATQSQNNANSPGRGNRSSRYKGVYWHQSSRWRALIEVDGKKRHLGCFHDEDEAARAYNAAALAAWGEFAYLNPVPTPAPTAESPLGTALP